MVGAAIVCAPLADLSSELGGTGKQIWLACLMVNLSACCPPI